MKEALRYSAALLGELRTSLLRYGSAPMAVGCAGRVQGGCGATPCHGMPMLLSKLLVIPRSSPLCAALKSTTSCTCRLVTSYATWRQAQPGRRGGAASLALPSCVDGGTWRRCCTDILRAALFHPPTHIAS